MSCPIYLFACLSVCVSQSKTFYKCHKDKFFGHFVLSRGRERLGIFFSTAACWLKA